jgi:hypothetical protein
MILLFIFSAALLLVTGIGARIVKKESDLFKEWVERISWSLKVGAPSLRRALIEKSSLINILERVQPTYRMVQT